jgi:hypothetical protein
MRARHVLYVMLVFMVVLGASEASGTEAAQPAAGWELLTAFLMSFLPFYWYRLDSEARNFRPSRWLSMVIVAVTTIGLPVYLLRTRPRGQRVRALLRFGGFYLLVVLAALLGAVLRAGPGWHRAL